MFEINESGVLVKYNGTEKEVRIPDKVVAIGDDAFARNNKIRSVIFSPSVKSIGRDAFKYCMFLTNVELNEGLVNIDERAFYYCSSLETVKFPSSLKKIGEYAFWNCAFEKIDIPCVKRICSHAFEECNSLRNIRLGEGCEEIASCAFPTIEFHGVDIYLPESIRKIDKHAFGGKDSFFDRNFRNYFSPQNKIILDYARNDYGISTWTYTPNESQIQKYFDSTLAELKARYAARYTELVETLIPENERILEKYRTEIEALKMQKAEQKSIQESARGIFAYRKRENCEKLIKEISDKIWWKDKYFHEYGVEERNLNYELKNISAMDEDAYIRAARESIIAEFTKKQQEIGNCVSYRYTSGARVFVDDYINAANSASSSKNSSTLPNDDAWGRPAGTSGPPPSGKGI